MPIDQAAMDIVKALVLGIVQGLTEFLPVSSSGHLEIVNHLMGSGEAIDSDLLMVIIAHLGTAFSIVYVFRKDISAITLSLLKFEQGEELNLALKILISMIPATIVGLLFENQLEALFASETLIYVGIFLCCTAVVLWFTPKTIDKGGRVTLAKSVLVGIAQAVAVLPGISRSGMTISAALYLGVDKAKAARFSFLMVLPIIFGKVILDLASGDLVFNHAATVPLLTVLFSSFIVGIGACKWMLLIVQKSRLSWFAVYCFILGMVIIVGYFI